MPGLHQNWKQYVLWGIWSSTWVVASLKPSITIHKLPQNIQNIDNGNPSTIHNANMHNVPSFTFKINSKREKSTESNNKNHNSLTCHSSLSFAEMEWGRWTKSFFTRGWNGPRWWRSWQHYFAPSSVDAPGSFDLWIVACFQGCVWSGSDWIWEARISKSSLSLPYKRIFSICWLAWSTLLLGKKINKEKRRNQNKFWRFQLSSGNNTILRFNKQIGFILFKMNMNNKQIIIIF